MLQSARADLQRLAAKQPLSATHSASSFPSLSPPPALIPLNASEKKQSNNVSTETQPMQAKRRQLEDFIKKVGISYFYIYTFFYIIASIQFLFLKIGTNAAVQCECPSARS